MDLPTLKPSEGFQPAFSFNTLQSCHKSPIFVFLAVDLGWPGSAALHLRQTQRWIRVEKILVVRTV